MLVIPDQAQPPAVGVFVLVLPLALMSLDPTGQGRKRWAMRWKAPLNAFQIAFDGRLTQTSN